MNTTKFLYCVLIQVCAVIRSNTVIRDEDKYHSFLVI